MNKRPIEEDKEYCRSMLRPAKRRSSAQPSIKKLALVSPNKLQRGKEAPIF
jgi:hypothetical protein